jgi:hypothetical protein
MGHDVTIFTLNEGTLPIRDVWSGVDVHRPLLVNIIEAFPQLTIEDIRKKNMRMVGYYGIGFAVVLLFVISGKYLMGLFS